MKRRVNVRRSSVALFAALTMIVPILGLTCPDDDGTAPLDPPVAGGNRPPRVSITNVATPTGNDFAEQGETVTIAFNASDSEDRATVRVFASTSPNPTGSDAQLPILSNFPVGPGSATGQAFWQTSTILPGSYFIFAEADDGTYDPVALTGNPPVRVTWINPILIGPPGTGVENAPPSVAIEIPSSDAGLSNGDILTIRFRVTDPNFDKDTIQLTYYFDTDRNAANDASSPPIIVGNGTIPAGTPSDDPFIEMQAEIQIDLNTMPLRRETDEGGRPLPYFLRVRADDGNGGVVDQYAVGAIRLLTGATDVVDLRNIGGLISGARWQGFYGFPNDTARGARAGSAFTPLGDIDNDGLDDFAIVAETASPGNNTRVGEVYVIYGRRRTLDVDLPTFPFAQGRYAGINSLATVGTFVSFPLSDPRFETIFNVRGNVIPFMAVTQPPFGLGSFGITSVGRVGDLTEDGLPELLIGAPLADSVFDREDYDPCDDCVVDDDALKFVCFGGGTTSTQTANLNLGNLAAGQWGPFDPANAPAAENPNVDFNFDEKRADRIFALTLTISGTRADAQGGPVTFELLVENVNGPGFATNPIIADNNGQFEGTVGFPTPQLPAGAMDSMPVSIYDGLFTLFARPSVAVTNLQITVNMNVRVLEEVEHPLALVYLDGMPAPFSDSPTCGTSTEVPANPFALDSLPATCPPMRRLIDTNLDGHICADLPANAFVFQGGPNNDDFSQTFPSLYQSGFVFFCASNNITLITDPDTGLFTRFNTNGPGNRGDEVRTNALLARFGQGPYLRVGGEGLQGARFRGAWYQPEEYYDPGSLFGYTIDSLPDIDSFGITEHGQATSELLVSAPNGTTSLPLSFNTIPQLTGEYKASEPTRKTVSVIIPPGLSKLVAGSLFISGEATNLPRLRMVLNDLQGVEIPGTATEALIWSGAGFPPGNDQPPTIEFAEVYNDIDVPFSTELVLPTSTLQFAGGAIGSITLEILEDCAVTDSSANISNVSLFALGLFATGNVMVIQGSDYSQPMQDVGIACPPPGNTDGDSESGDDRPMSWPEFSYPCDPGSGGQLGLSGGRFLCKHGEIVRFVGEETGDGLGFAHHAGDLDLNGVADIAMGAPMASSDPGQGLGAKTNNGKVYYIFGNQNIGNQNLGGDPPSAYERFELRGSHNDDQFGRVQGNAGDLNGDGNDDVYFAAEGYDALGAPLFDAQNNPINSGADAGFVGILFGGQTRTGENGINVERAGTGNFRGCKFIGGSAGARLGGGKPANTTFVPAISRGQAGVASAGDFNGDGFTDLLITAPGQAWPAMRIEFLGDVADGQTVTINGLVFEFDTNNNISPNRVRVALTSTTATAAQLALMGTLNITPAETSNIANLVSQTSFPDPEPDRPTISFLRRRFTSSGSWVTTNSPSITIVPMTRQGVAYVVFGSDTLLNNKTFILPDDMNRRAANGTRVLRGVIFVSAYEKDTGVNDTTPDEAPIEVVSGIGDTDGDGFSDIILGAPTADFINILAPNEQRRQSSGDAYMIYGNQFGLNDAAKP